MNETKILPIAISQIRGRKEQMPLHTKHKFQISMEAGDTVPASLEYSTLSLQAVQTVQYIQIWQS
jgi:hypothetical protein